MNKSEIKHNRRVRRHNRIRAKLNGTVECPRLCVFRSNRYLYAQLIDDEKGTTIASIDTRKETGDTARNKARNAGAAMAALAKKANVGTVVFDRGGFLFTGLVKEFADGAREAGLNF